MSCSSSSPPPLLLKIDDKVVPNEYQSHLSIQSCLLGKGWALDMATKDTLLDESVLDTLSFIDRSFVGMTSLQESFSQQVQCRYYLIDLLRWIMHNERQTFDSMVDYTSQEWEYPRDLCLVIMKYLHPSPLYAYARALLGFIPSVSRLYEAFYGYYKIRRTITFTWMEM